MATKQIEVSTKEPVSKKHIKSLREYIDALKSLGEIQEIDKEVDWNLEIGAITRRVYETSAPAPLFNNIKGIQKGFRVLGAPAATSRQEGLYLARVALSLGLDPRATGQEMIQALVEARSRKGIPPKPVKTAPCKENIRLGDDVNLFQFPTPLIHDGDGGRYFNTLHDRRTKSGQEMDELVYRPDHARRQEQDDRYRQSLSARRHHSRDVERYWKANAVCTGARLRTFLAVRLWHASAAVRQRERICGRVLRRADRSREV